MDIQMYSSKDKDIKADTANAVVEFNKNWWK